MIFFVLEKQMWYFFHDSSCKIFHGVILQSTAGNTEKKKGKKGQEKKKLKILILSLKPSRSVRDYKIHLKPLTKCFAGIGTETQFS